MLPAVLVVGHGGADRGDLTHLWAGQVVRVFPVSSPAIIATKEKINELRAKQRRHSCEEFNLAQRIKFSIEEQRRLEAEAMTWVLYLQKLKAEEAVKQSEGSWLLKKILGS